MSKEPIPENLWLQWHPTKNGELTPDMFSKGSSRKVWWVGECGHEWDALIYRRVFHNAGCPYCANKRVLIGFNDLATTHPDLAAQWHPTKNGELTPEMVLAGSNVKVCWLGECGHEWRTKLYERGKQHHTCPYCTNQRVLTGFNDLATTHPDLAKQWHPTKNGELTPETITSGSNRKVWWVGECGHEWRTDVRTRRDKGSGCRKCVNGEFRSLRDVHPEWEAYYDEVKNETPYGEVPYGTGRVLHWVGGCGHRWSRQGVQAKELHCPYCANKRVLIGFNDLATTHPDLAAQWHLTKNGELTPEKCTRGTHKKVVWVCAKGHEWEANVNDRTFYRTGCPACAAKTFSSSGEQELSEYILSLGVVALQNDRTLLGSRQELDLYIPGKRIAFEYNGLYWHTERTKGKSYHHDKWLACEERGIQLIQIWEDDWKGKQKLVERMIAYKLGVHLGERVFARHTTVKAVLKEEIDVFLETNHLQGKVTGATSYGLVDLSNDKLVAVACFRKSAYSENRYELARYATSVQVVGGFTKLVKHFLSTHKEVTELTTFSDNCVSNGKLYEQNGWVQDGQIHPDYMYLRGGVRHHKFGYRIKKFRNDPTLVFEEGLTEKELAELNGMPRIWDAGKTRWVYRVAPSPNL